MFAKNLLNAQLIYFFIHINFSFLTAEYSIAS